MSYANVGVYIEMHEQATGQYFFPGVVNGTVLHHKPVENSLCTL